MSEGQPRDDGAKTLRREVSASVERVKHDPEITVAVGGHEPVKTSLSAISKLSSQLAMIEIPTEEDFASAEFMEDPGLTAVGHDLIDRYEKRFAFLQILDLKFGWKKVGGSSNGKVQHGGCIKPTGINRQFIGADFVFWLAADEFGFRYGDVVHTEIAEPYLFHQLCHAGWNPKHGQPVLRPHEFEGFGAEIEEYGLWNVDLQYVGRIFRQSEIDLSKL